MQRSLHLHLSPADPSALQRVIATCNARRLPVVALAYERDDAVGRTRLVIEGEEARLDRAPAWLGNLVSVLRVERAADAP